MTFEWDENKNQRNIKLHKIRSNGKRKERIL